MASTMDHNGSPAPLKGKLNHVKDLLDDANKRLHEEAAKYEIFTTKSSASSVASKQQQQNGGRSQADVPKDLQRTIADISTIQSVLSCPIFGQIVNVTDSLDKLSYHLNLRPSIGPVDISINSNGELILAPPIEPASLNNLINGRLEDYSQNSSGPQVMMEAQQDLVPNQTNGNGDGNRPFANGYGGFNETSSGVRGTTTAMLDTGNLPMIAQHRFSESSADHHHKTGRMKATKQHISSSALNDNYVQANDYLHQDENVNGDGNALSYKRAQQQHDDPIKANSYTSQTNSSSLSNVSTLQQHQQKQQQQQHIQQQQLKHSQEYDTEKLVGVNGGGAVGGGSGVEDYVNGGRRRRSSQEPSKVQSVAAAFESAIAESSENRGLYKANGNFALNQMFSNNMDVKRNFETGRQISSNKNQAPTATNTINDSPHTLGYTNEMYKTAHEIAGSTGENMNVDYQKMSMDSNNDQTDNAYANNLPQATDGKQRSRVATTPAAATVATNQRASPSTSAGSTVRLADECDSGTSSFRSQAAKGALYSPQSHKPIAQLDEDPTDSSIDQELIEKLSPEMERIKVTLEKDSAGLGITIAGYTCEQEEISGIFIKSITPDSPADRSGKIRILDQIFAVNGQEILGYSNPEATNVLRRHTGRVVTLELMRYLAESKYKKLQTLLGHAEPMPNIKANTKNSTNSNKNMSPGACNKQVVAGGAKTPASLVSRTSAGEQLIMARPGMSSSSPKQTFQSRASTGEVVPPAQLITNESMYNNTSAYAPSDMALSSSLVSGGVANASQAAGDYSHGQSNCSMPVAAQRGATLNKVIETKQGARNTIDIRSPMCQTSTTSNATYINESSVDMMYSNSVGGFKGGGTGVTGANNSRSNADRLKQEAVEEFGQLVRTEKLEWECDVQIVELNRDSSQSLGFTVKDYANPKDPRQSIFMIVHITAGGIAEQDGRLSVGDLLVFVDDTNLEGASPNEAVRALKRTSGQVRLGVLKYKRNF